MSVVDDAVLNYSEITSIRYCSSTRIDYIFPNDSGRGARFPVRFRSLPGLHDRRARPPGAARSVSPCAGVVDIILPRPASRRRCKTSPSCLFAPPWFRAARRPLRAPPCRSSGRGAPCGLLRGWGIKQTRAIASAGDDAASTTAATAAAAAAAAVAGGSPGGGSHHSPGYADVQPPRRRIVRHLPGSSRQCERRPMHQSRVTLIDVLEGQMVRAVDGAVVGASRRRELGPTRARGAKARLGKAFHAAARRRPSPLGI